MITEKWKRRKERLRLNGKTWKVPFDRSGNMMHFCSGMYRSGKLIEASQKYFFKDNTIFHDEMKVQELQCGRSARTIILKSLNTEKLYYMFLNDFVDMVSHSMIYYNCVLKENRIDGYWTYVKRGDYFGIKACQEHGDPCKIS